MRRIKILFVDNVIRTRCFERGMHLKFGNQVYIKSANSTEEALYRLSEPFDVLGCHIRFDENKVAFYAKRKYGGGILTVGTSVGGLSDYMVKSMDYDLFVEYRSITNLFDEFEKVLTKRGLLEEIVTK